MALEVCAVTVPLLITTTLPPRCPVAWMPKLPLTVPSFVTLTLPPPVPNALIPLPPAAMLAVDSAMTVTVPIPSL